MFYLSEDLILWIFDMTGRLSIKPVFAKVSSTDRSEDRLLFATFFFKPYYYLIFH